MMIGVILYLTAFVFASSQGQHASAQKPNNYGIGVEDKWHKEMNMIDEMINRFDRDNIREILRYLSEKPHMAASPRDDETAEYVRKKFEEAGFDSSELVPYNIYLSKPDPQNPNMITLDMNGETNLRESLQRSTVSTEPGVGVVYVNYGRVEDFEKLEELGINVTGHIVIVRYGKIFRGNKVNLAEKFGAKGIIIFSDPQDVAGDGIAPENVYDHTWWLPGTGMQRGSTFIGEGDPLTPLWPSTEHAYRLSEDEAKLPKIPGQPIGYSDAIEILKRLDGPVAPEDWQGGYPGFTYKLGPFFNNQNESVSLTLSTHNSGKIEKSYNVIGIIKGSIEPDRYVLFGNHRDAWGYGAVDPSSGTAQLLETARVFGTFLKEGWRPRRTIVFCSWGAEEFGLIGSTEWVEENVDKLQSRAVGYINSDICTSGPELYIAGSPLMQGLFMNIPGVQDSSKTLFDEWREYGERYKPNSNEYPITSTLGSGSDHGPFSFYAGVPSADITFDRDETIYNISSYPFYHTGYETFYMVTAFVDPEFKIHEGCGRLSILALKYLADSTILPYSLRRLPSIMMSNLQKNSHRNKLIEMYDKYTELESSMEKFAVSVSKFEKMLKSSTSLSELQVRAINDQMMKLEQIFVIPEGLPGRPSIRNAAFASSQFDDYASSGFPALSDLLYDFDSLNQTEQQSRTKTIKRHISDLMIMTDRAADFLDDVFYI
ncbi:N-acetylated-alpha-linked acidic dipeptidase 2 [Armadillidium vulgare]|nr:N-acetylated-alpha-linked acidic dipeptidase 2 [Armadillidium vulgare]